MSKALLGLYERIKTVLEEAGGYESLSEEQRDLFNHAVDKLMGAKFEHVGLEETEVAVSAFLDAMSSESELLPEESLPEEPLKEEPDIHDELKGRYISSLHNASVLIRASDALDRAGQGELASELDIILRKLAGRQK
jgi:hypothetical protein